MFEAAEVGRKVAKRVYKDRIPSLRNELLQAQFALAETDIPVIVIVSGVDGAGKGEVVNRLSGWLDSRLMRVHAFGPKSDEESERPRFWRYWRTLPPKGTIGILFGSWYTGPILQHVYGDIDQDRLDHEMRRIGLFERMLVEDGAIVVKLWFHLSRSAEKERFKKLEADPETAWRVTPQDWKHFKKYKSFVKVCERALRATDSGEAPWIVIESSDERYRDLTAAETILDAINTRLAAGTDVDSDPQGPRLKTVDTKDAKVTILGNCDLSKKLALSTYERKLSKMQAKLNALTWEAKERGVSTVAMFEGWDAAGKGGAIRRVTAAVDARLTQVISIASPTDEERAQHYLWRFWRHIPRAGTVTIYDRSWYGRVLVERVEGFARPHEWQRAYSEITEFEEQLVDGRVALAKFWLHIDPDEQERRFQEREVTPHKAHKLTEEDWRNRERWDAYEAAINDMVSRTSTEFAPWTIVPANDKFFARIHVLETLCDRLEVTLAAD